MKKCLTGVMCLIFILLSGCGAADADQGSMPQSGSGTQEEQLSGINSGIAPEEEKIGEGSQPGVPADDTASGTEGGMATPEDTSSADEEGTDISAENTVPGMVKTTIDEFSGTAVCIGDSILLLAEAKIILRDGSTLEVQKEAENTAPSLVDIQAYMHDDVFTLLGSSFDDGRFKMVEFDGDLQVKRITDIEEVSGSEREIMTCRLLSDENKILYSSINGFYLFDILSGETRDLTQEGIFVHDFACLEEKEEILFSGSDSLGKRILGRVDINGKGLQKENEDHLWGEMWAFGDYALIGEAELVGKEREGVVFRYDEREGIRSFPLADSNENGNITVSCRGAYYGTRTAVRNDELRYVIRVYSSEDGSMIKELPLSYEEYGENFRLRGYLICDDTDRIILYGTWRGRETDTWIVSIDL